MFVKARGSVQERAEARKATRTMFRNMALFLSAPFIGLLYAILLPFVGLGMLAWFAAKALRQSETARQRVRVGAKVVAIAMAPFAGLVYLVALPFIGLGMLAWFGVRTAIAPAA
jgi:nitrogen fixation/metabolism regulation signal transduction histidine kinase